MEPVKQGIFGLLLYLSNWLSPSPGKATIDYSLVNRPGHTIQVRCRLGFDWNSQMEQLIDAGIPLKFRFSIVGDRCDSVLMYRTMKFNVVDYTYSISDSSKSGVRRSGHYPQVLLALRDFSRWSGDIDVHTTSCRIEAHILPSMADQLGRHVDMSRVWGRSRVAAVFNPQEILGRKKGTRKP